MPTKMEELAGQIKEKRNRLQGFYAKKGADGTLDVTAAERDEMKSINDELSAVVPRYEQFQKDARAEADNKKALDALLQPTVPAGFFGGAQFGGDGSSIAEFFAGKSIQKFGELFVATDGYKSYQGNVQAGQRSRAPFTAFNDNVDVKTLFSTNAGFDPFVTRLPGIVLSAQQQPKVIDLIPTAETTQHSIKYMLETVYVNNAAETAEGGQYPESQFQVVEQLVPVNKVGHSIPVTDEQLADAPLIRDYLNGRLELGLRQRLDLQLLVGNGTSPNLTGLFNVAGTQTYAVNSEPVPDAFFKAMVLIQSVGFADPSGIIMSPHDWQNIRLLRTTQGLYIWGNPDSSGPQRMWGLPVVSTTYCPQGTGVVADFPGYTTLYYRKGVDFLVTNSHLGNFTLGIMNVRADMRVAFVVNRGKAVCTVTGIPA